MNTNKDEVVELVSSDKAVSNVMIGYFAKRERDFRSDGNRAIRLESVRMALAKQKIKLSSTDIVNAFKRLEAAGAGKIVVGRHGNPTRLQCNPDLIELAKMIADTSTGVLVARQATKKVTNLDTRITIQYNGCTIIGTKDKVRNIVEHLLDETA